jgi:uncharacterized membrane protein YfcA
LGYFGGGSRRDVVTWQLVLAGLLIGTLVGLTGMGGGSLMTPILVLLFHFDPAVAIGTDIAHGAVFKSVGAVQHRRMGNVAARLSGWMFIGSAPMSLLGVWLAAWLATRYGDSVESTMGRVLGVALLFGSVGLLAKNFVGASAATDAPFILTRRDRIAAVLIGMFGGFIVGLTSVGSGVFFGLTLLVVFPLRAHKIVGTDIFHAAALLYVAGFGHALAGNIDLGAVGWLLIGSIPGVLIGGRLTLAVPEQPLRLLIAGVLGLSGLKLVDVPGGSTVIVILLCAGAVAFLTYLGRRTWVRTRRRPPLEGVPGPDD